MTLPRVEHLDVPRWTDDFGPARLSKEALDVIVACTPLVEAGARTGYWAERARELGADVVTTSPRLPRSPWGAVVETPPTFAARGNPDRTLLLIWPSAEPAPWAHLAVRAYSGKRVIYVGDPQFRFTASPALVQALADFREVHRTPIGSWAGALDHLIVYERTA